MGDEGAVIKTYRSINKPIEYFPFSKFIKLIIADQDSKVTKKLTSIIDLVFHYYTLTASGSLVSKEDDLKDDIVVEEFEATVLSITWNIVNYDYSFLHNQVMAKSKSPTSFYFPSSGGEKLYDYWKKLNGFNPALEEDEYKQHRDRFAFIKSLFESRDGLRDINTTMFNNEPGLSNLFLFMNGFSEFATVLSTFDNQSPDIEGTQKTLLRENIRNLLQRYRSHYIDNPLVGSLTEGNTSTEILPLEDKKTYGTVDILIGSLGDVYGKVMKKYKDSSNPFISGNLKRKDGTSKNLENGFVSWNTMTAKLDALVTSAGQKGKANAPLIESYDTYTDILKNIQTVDMFSNIKYNDNTKSTWDRYLKFSSQNREIMILKAGVLLSNEKDIEILNEELLKIFGNGQTNMSDQFVINKVVSLVVALRISSTQTTKLRLSRTNKGILRTLLLIVEYISWGIFKRDGVGFSDEKIATTATNIYNSIGLTIIKSISSGTSKDIVKSVKDIIFSPNDFIEDLAWMSKTTRGIYKTSLDKAEKKLKDFKNNRVRDFSKMDQINPYSIVKYGNYRKNLIARYKAVITSLHQFTSIITFLEKELNLTNNDFFRYLTSQTPSTVLENELTITADQGTGLAAPMIYKKIRNRASLFQGFLETTEEKDKEKVSFRDIAKQATVIISKLVGISKKMGLVLAIPPKFNFDSSTLKVSIHETYLYLISGEPDTVTSVEIQRMKEDKTFVEDFKDYSELMRPQYVELMGYEKHAMIFAIMECCLRHMRGHIESAAGLFMETNKISNVPAGGVLRITKNEEALIFLLFVDIKSWVFSTRVKLEPLAPFEISGFGQKKKLLFPNYIVDKKSAKDDVINARTKLVDKFDPSDLSKEDSFEPFLTKKEFLPITLKNKPSGSFLFQDNTYNVIYNKNSGVLNVKEASGEKRHINSIIYRSYDDNTGIGVVESIDNLLNLIQARPGRFDRFHNFSMEDKERIRKMTFKEVEPVQYQVLQFKDGNTSKYLIVLENFKRPTQLKQPKKRFNEGLTEPGIKKEGLVEKKVIPDIVTDQAMYSNQYFYLKLPFNVASLPFTSLYYNVTPNNPAVSKFMDFYTKNIVKPTINQEIGDLSLSTTVTLGEAQTNKLVIWKDKPVKSIISSRETKFELVCFTHESPTEALVWVKENQTNKAVFISHKFTNSNTFVKTLGYINALPLVQRLYHDTILYTQFNWWNAFQEYSLISKTQKGDENPKPQSDTLDTLEIVISGLNYIREDQTKIGKTNVTYQYRKSDSVLIYGYGKKYITFGVRLDNIWSDLFKYVIEEKATDKKYDVFGFIQHKGGLEHVAVLVGLGHGKEEKDLKGIYSMGIGKLDKTEDGVNYLLQDSEVYSLKDVQLNDEFVSVVLTTNQKIDISKNEKIILHNPFYNDLLGKNIPRSKNIVIILDRDQTNFIWINYQPGSDMSKFIDGMKPYKPLKYGRIVKVELSRYDGTRAAGTFSVKKELNGSYSYTFKEEGSFLTRNLLLGNDDTLDVMDVDKLDDDVIINRYTTDGSIIFQYKPYPPYAISGKNEDGIKEFCRLLVNLPSDENLRPSEDKNAGFSPDSMEEGK